MRRLNMKNFSELLRETYRRELSALLMHTDREHHKECGLGIEVGDTVVNVEYLYQVTGSGEIAVGTDQNGYAEEVDLDEISLPHQREIIEFMYMRSYRMDYEPMVLVERAADGKATPLAMFDKMMLHGGAYPLIVDTLREHLGEDLDEYCKKAAGEGLLCDGDFYLVTHNLAAGQRQSFLGRDYYFETEQGARFDGIDDLIRLTPEQQALAGEMRALYERMQQANIAFAINDNGSVVCYNCEHIDDCEPAHVFASIPDGYEVADMEQMQSLFPVWQGETMCLLREEEE